jgi:hypothetical protein
MDAFLRGSAGVECVSSRQNRTISRLLSYVNFVTFVYFSPAFAFIGRTMITSRTPADQ